MTAASSGYIAISRRPLDLEDYIDVVRRHVAWIIGPLFLGLVVSISVAFMLPNSYRSEAVMQITPGQVSDDLVKTTGNQLMVDRIIQMEGDILSRTSLSALIQSPDLLLYPAERNKMPMEDVVELMKTRDLKIDITNMAALGKHASAFKISFSYTNRFKAQQTVQKLISRFVDSNQSSQRDQQTLLHDLFGDELAQAKANLEKTSEELTRFRTENQGRLPEQSQMNMSNLAALQTQVNGVQDQLNRLAQQRVQAEAHLSTLKNQLDLYGLMAQEAPASLGGGSPAMRRNVELEQLNKQIEGGELQLQQYLQSFKETYPDIRNLRKSLAVLTRKRDELQAKQDELLAADAAKPKDAPRKSTNFQVAQNQTAVTGEIDSTNALLKNIDSERSYKQKELEDKNRQIDEFRNRLSATSSIEARYADLLREQSNATAKYQTMQQKQDLVAQNTELISRKAGEKLDILDPASIPTNPFSPNRYMIVGGGLAASFILGLALAGVQEAKDTSLKNLKDVRAYTNLPVLCSIPLLENTLLVKRKKRITYLAWSAAVILGIIAICSALFYYYSAGGGSVSS
jgi:succinoglycan biosynthesis transport protein ExoP